MRVATIHYQKPQSAQSALHSQSCLMSLSSSKEHDVSLWRHGRASPHICGLRRLIVQILHREFAAQLLHSGTEGPALKPTGNFQHYAFSYVYSFKKMA